MEEGNNSMSCNCYIDVILLFYQIDCTLHVCGTTKPSWPPSDLGSDSCDIHCIHPFITSTSELLGTEELAFNNKDRF